MMINSQKITSFVPLLLLMIAAVAVPVANATVAPNSDDNMNNDIPPDGDGMFCDHPSNPGSCYDRHDNPEAFCVLYPQYTKFCEIIEPICDDDVSVNAISSMDPECTPKDKPCPQDFVRNGEYCARYKADCDVVAGESNVYCNGKIRTDGMLGCDRPWHPGYKFCNN